MEESPTGAAMLSHMVYFTLEDNSAEAKNRLIAACHKYLTDHQGTMFFAAGTLSDLNRPVNDRQFDVGLNVVFESREDHDRYQTSERHLQFIEENKGNWEKVRVFDANVTSRLE